MKRPTVVVALVLGVALAGNALAREKKAREKPKRASGALISATVEGGVVKWKVAVDDEGEKTFEMASQVVVVYSEKNGQKRARMIRAAGRKQLEAKGNRLVAQGELVGAETQGNKVVAKIKIGEGAEAAEQEFTLGARLGVTYREQGDKLTALAVSSARSGKAKREKGEGAREGRKGKKDKNNRPENL